MHIQSFQFNFRMEEERWVTSMSLSAALLHFAFFSKSFFYKKATKAVTLTVPGSALLLDEECGDADHLQLTMWMHSLLTESSKTTNSAFSSSLSSASKPKPPDLN